MNKVICIILTLFVLVGCATTGNYIWSNSNPQLHNQAVLNQDLAICKEYAYQASMGMPTKVNPSGYNINYNEYGNINYNQYGNYGYGSINSSGYSSITPKYTWGDAVQELSMNLKKSDRKEEAFDNCMTSKGWSKVQANTSTTKPSYDECVNNCREFYRKGDLKAGVTIEQCITVVCQ
jgi:hypothetical protein